jgi:VWFA-related protein
MLLAKLILYFAMSTLLVIATAQDSQESGRQPSFHSQTNLVLAPALVKDKNGEIIYGLTAKDFIIEDDGVEQLVHLDEQPEAAPLSLVVAIQLGRTAAAELPRMRTLGTMLDPILSQGRSRCAIVTFDSAVELTRNFTTNGALIAADLNRLRPGDHGAAILDAIGYSIALLRQEPKERQRVLLLVSETRDHGSHVVTLEDTVEAIAGSNALVYTLAFSPTASNVLDDVRGKLERKGNAVDLGELATKLMIMAVQAMRRNTPKTIASVTGGEYEFFASHKGFESRMADFSNHLRNRYLLSFEPKDPHPGLHKVSVRLRQTQDTTIVARDRYWAGGPEGDH